MKKITRCLNLTFTLVLFAKGTFSQTEFWGLSREGGTFGYGSIFKTNNEGNNPVSIYSFTDTLNGINPEGSLFQASNRKLYGMTKYGGSFNMGTIFEYDIYSNTFSKRFDFDSVSSGCYPSGSLTGLENGQLLYGKNGSGGLNNLGTLFSFDFNTKTYTKLRDFDITNTGGNSENGSLVVSNSIDSNWPTVPCLIGVNPIGGSTYQGMVFVYDIYRDLISRTKEFPTMPGYNHQRGDLTEISPGIFLGMNVTGGNSLNGYIYEYNWNTNSLVIKLSFDTISGTKPFGKLTKGLNGKFYGMTSEGGSFNKGTLFEFDRLNNAFTNILDFGGPSSNISNPHGSLLSGSNGKLYGMGTLGSTCDGVLFEYDCNTNQLTEKSDLCTLIGSTVPYYSSLIEIDPDTSLTVWPGETNLDFQVNNADFLYLGVAYNEFGPMRTGASTNFQGQSCAPWNFSYYYRDIIDAKNADCNGDGIVDTLDAQAIYLNYEKRTPLRLGHPQNKINSHDLLCFLPDRNPIATGDPVNFDINMASATAPMDFAYGLAFSVFFDPALIDTTRISFDFSTSALGSIGVNMISFEKRLYSTGRIDVALVKTDHIDGVSIGGKLGVLQMYASPNISALTKMEIRSREITAIRATGSTFILHECFDTLVINPNLVSIKNLSFSDNLSIYPIPAKEKITINSGNEALQLIEIFNLSGELIFSLKSNKNETSFSTVNISSGLYLIRSITNQKVYNSYIQIIH